METKAAEKQQNKDKPKSTERWAKLFRVLHTEDQVKGEDNGEHNLAFV